MTKHDLQYNGWMRTDPLDKRWKCSNCQVEVSFTASMIPGESAYVTLLGVLARDDGQVGLEEAKEVLRFHVPTCEVQTVRYVMLS